MKKILFFMLALLAFVACDDLYGGTDDPTAPDATGDVTIEFSEVNDYGFTVTLTPTRAASYYSYLVDDEGIDLSAELSASTLFQGGYSSVASGVVNYSENPSYTFTVEAEEPNLTYYVYAVAGSAEQQSLGEICVNSVTTTYVPICEVSISAEYDKETYVLTATVSFSGDADYVKVGYAEGTSEDEIETGVDGIIDGSIKSEQLDESGEIQFTISDDASYSAIAVAYYNGEPIDFDYDTFKVDHSAWVSLGMCTYRDDYMASYYFGMEESCFEYEVEIQERESTPGLFRLVNPYGAAYPIHNEESWNKFWTYWTYYWYGYDNYNVFPWDELEEGQPYDDSQDYYIEIDASDPDGVFIDMQNTGMDYGDGWIYVYSFASSYMDNGYTLDQVKNYGYCGTYENGVITFPVDALLMYEPGYNPTSYYYANDFGMFRVILPGSVVRDYSIDIEYNGRLVDPSGNNSAYVTVTMGDDVSYALGAMVEGNDYNAAIEAIKAGTVDCQTITQSGGVQFACEESGLYTIAVVSYGGGEAQKSAYVTFTYVVDEGTTSEWGLYGTGDWEYSVFFSGDDPGLEIYQNNYDPSKFKIEHWCYDVDFTFTWDQETNEIVVDDQETGYTYYYYGMTYIDDVSDYYGIGESFYKDGIFYFSVVYYSQSAGLYGVGCETFALEGSTKPTYTVDDLLGSYLLYGVSNFGSYYDEQYLWTFEASDDSSKGNVMLTTYNGWTCDEPIYGTFDSDGTITFDTGTKGIFFYGGTTYDYYFISYIAYYYSGRYGTEAYMTYLPNDSIIGPLEGDLICELAYYAGTSSAAGWNQAFECIAGPRYNYGPSALSASEKKEADAVSDKVNRAPFAPSKVKFSKPEIVELEDGIVLASSSMRPTGDNSSNGSNKGVSKDVRKGTQKSVEVQKNSSKESIKDAIKQSKGMNN